MGLPYNFYNAYKIIAQTPSQSIKNDLQALIDSKFNVATSVFTIKEEGTIGSNIWQDIQVRLVHKINVDTGVRLSDDWRNIIFQNTDHVFSLGMKYDIDGDIWIAINTESKKMVTQSGLIRRTNWVLKWYNEKGVLIQEPCIVDYVKMIGSAMGIVEGKEVREGAYDRFVYLQKNTETAKINRDQRFFLDDLVFRVTKRDAIAHNGLIELSLDEHQINEEVDDVTNGIADYTNRPSVDISDIGTTELFVGLNTISIGSNGLWNIYKKINGVKQLDTYTFSLIGSGATIVTYTNNTISLKAGDVKNISFVLRATNTTSLAVINKTINVIGMW